MYLEVFLSADTAAVDMDLELRTTDGQVLNSSTSSTANERVFGKVQPNTRYILRVLGWANGPTQFRIVSDQLLLQGSSNANSENRTIGGSSVFGSGSGSGTTTGLTRLVRFTVNPLTKTVTAKLLQ